MADNKTSESVEFKFTNPYTHKEEEYDYYLDSDDIIDVMRFYADYYSVTLDGTDNSVFNLFASLDSGRYHYINEVFEKMLEKGYVKEKITEKIKAKAQEEFEEEAEAKFENNIE